MIAPLIACNTFAIVGQCLWAHATVFQSVPDPLRWVLAAGFAGTVESIAIYLSVTSSNALRAGDSSFGLRLVSYAIGLGVGALNYAHQAPNVWEPNAQAVMFGGFSSLSPWLWAVHSRRKHRDELKGEGLIDPRQVRFPALQWALWFGRTFSAWRQAAWSHEQQPEAARRDWELRRIAEGKSVPGRPVRAGELDVSDAPMITATIEPERVDQAHAETVAAIERAELAEQRAQAAEARAGAAEARTHQLAEHAAEQLANVRAEMAAELERIRHQAAITPQRSQASVIRDLHAEGKDVDQIEAATGFQRATITRTVARIAAGPATATTATPTSSNGSSNGQARGEP